MAEQLDLTFDGAITRPMAIVLYDAVDEQRGAPFEPGMIRPIYPAGQQRMIVSGLYTRGLITRDDRERLILTAERGWTMALQVRARVRAYWPAGTTPIASAE